MTKKVGAIHESPLVKIKARSSFVGVETRNEARLSKLETRRDFSFLSFPRKRESSDFVKTYLSNMSHPIIMPTQAGISLLRMSMGIHPFRDCFVGLRLTKTSSQ
jgi:hypothetical protein